MSRLRPFVVDSFGFRRKEVSEDGDCLGGGVERSKPRFFFTNFASIMLDSFDRSTIRDPQPGHRQIPLATVHTETSAAPIINKTRAQALAVAPVVNTSSTNTTRSPVNC